MNKKRKQSLTKLADAAFLQAAYKAVAIARQTGTPVVVCEDGEIKKLDPRKTHLPPLKRRSRKKK